LGKPKEYLEPFAGSAAMLLAAPEPAPLEVIGDINFHVANFWRAVKFQPQAVARWSDYPVSHVDLDARHRWLVEAARTRALREALADAEWPGDARAAAWWAYGQCAWIGSRWCEKDEIEDANAGQAADAGAWVTSPIPFISHCGTGVQSKIPQISTGKGLQADTDAEAWLEHLSRRLRRVRVLHAQWDRCLNHTYGGEDTAIFLDPPYRGFERTYTQAAQAPVADAVAEWCRRQTGLRIALCGLVGDYDLPGWRTMTWDRGKATYSGRQTTAKECVWFSAECHDPECHDLTLFA
jgi:hypothetical protein